MKLAREAGALSVLPIALASRLAILLFEGEFAAAAALSEESDAVSRAMGSPFAPYGALVLATWRGRQAEALELIDGATSEALDRGEGQWLTASRGRQLCSLTAWDTSIGRCPRPHNAASTRTSWDNRYGRWLS